MFQLALCIHGTLEVFCAERVAHLRRALVYQANIDIFPWRLGIPSHEFSPRRLSSQFIDVHSAASAAPARLLGYRMT